ncbi:hypothetical protein [Aquimarina sediminis]|uniref:hypothetical protein n=1 Tax=Aquimarina sediminis TaxID=2070536 RepID=UPI000CA008F8|nr:hypothetical protein [Aquimarina sediminis]
MEYLNVLHQLFHKDTGWLTTGYLSTPKYREFLTQKYIAFYSHFSFTFPKVKEKFPTSIEYIEVPFYNYHVDNSKEGFVNIPLDQQICEMFRYITTLSGFQTSAIERLHLKETNGTVYVELFLREDFDVLSDIQLAYYYYYEQIDSIADHIKQQLLLLSFDEKKKEKRRRNTIRKYQVQLNHYIGILEQKLKTRDASVSNVRNIAIDRSMIDVYKCVCLGLEETLIHIEEYYGRYIDPSITITYLKRRSFIERYYEKCEQGITLFKAQGLPKAIEREVCKPLYAILQDTIDTMNYMQREYYRKYIDLFTRLLRKSKSVSHDEIYRLLIALNYNTHSVYKAMEEEALLRLGRISCFSEKQVFAFEQLHRIQNIAVTSPYKYHPQFPGLGEHLVIFFRKYIDLLQKQIELEKRQIKKRRGADIGKINRVDPKVGKRKINITVQELGLLSRLFTDIGVVSFTSKQKYFKFLSQIYTSKDTHIISEKSLKNSFYTISPEVFDSVQGLLIKMLNQLQKLRDTANRKKAM